MCVTVNAGNLYEGNTQNTLFCYKTYHHVADISCSNSSQKYIAVLCIWEGVLEKQHTIGVSVHKIVLEIPSKVFILKLSKNRCSKDFKKIIIP